MIDSGSLFNSKDVWAARWTSRSKSTTAARASCTVRTENVASEERRIELVDEPFRRLGGGRSFKPPRSDGWTAWLYLRYEIANALLGSAVAPAFELLATSRVDAFNRRADVVFDSAC